MNFFNNCLFISVLSVISHFSTAQTVSLKDGPFDFSWNPATDDGYLKKGSATIWKGSLMPAFWMLQNGTRIYLKATLSGAASNGIIPINIGNIGKGKMTVNVRNNRIDIDEINIEWTGAPPAIIEMYFGTRSLLQDTVNVPALWDRPFITDWTAAAYCIPGAKEGPAQSYFRMWDFGQATINLGNFGPSLGTPYGAAFPRPTLFGAMGSPDGWISFGSGEIPDAPLNIKLLSTKACFQYLYREDLWGPQTGNKRIWKSPLRITFDTTAYGAFKKYFASFSFHSKAGKLPARSLFNTWGMWRRQVYPIPPIVKFAKKIGAEMLVMDDQWESAQGSGKIHTERFPAFKEELKEARKKNLDIGFWETVGWIHDTVPYGLTRADLIVDTAGKPVRTNWSFDPGSPSFYCLDISSAKAKKYLEDRTRHMMQELHPKLLKLDFGYALPSPNMGVPRNPALRGERYSFELMKLIVDVAKQNDPEIVILNYGISPLWMPVTDIVSLDDQGDLWYEIKKGHGEWSIWASLLSDAGVMISGSSTYNWEDDKEVLLNTAILGIPGATLPIEPATPANENRRLALNKWYRRNIRWQPVWFNSETGSYERPPVLRCWGRSENNKLTAVALRKDQDDPGIFGGPAGIEFEGRWALISQDDRDIYQSSALALVPFDEGKLSIVSAKPKSIKKLNTDGEYDFTGWKWMNGKLTIAVSSKDLNDTAGFIITR